MKNQSVENKLKRCYEEEPKLVPSIVGAIDILGFSQMIVQSCKENTGNKLLREINYLINKNKQCVIPNKYSKGKIKIFTDNMVVAYPMNHNEEKALDEMLDNVAEYQFNLSLEGLFVRGGISVGDFFLNEDIVFGPALLDAHYAESEVACYPRIVLDEKTVEKLKKYLKEDVVSKEDKILIDTDGHWFINYLNTIFKYYRECHNPYEFERIQYELLKRHKEKVEHFLIKYQNNLRVWDKYVWVANYHNYFCDLHFKKEKDLRIAKNLLLSWPKKISKLDL